MLREALCVLAFNYQVQVSEVVEGAVRQKFKLSRPDDGNSHVLASIGNNCTCEQVLVNSDKALLVHAEVCKELCVLLEVLGQFSRWSLFDG